MQIMAGGQANRLIHAQPEPTGIDAEPAAVFAQALAQIRRQIDELDAALVTLIGKRDRLSRRALTLKARHGISLHSPQREREILERAKSLAVQHAVDAALLEQIFLLLLHQYVTPVAAPSD